jgi:P pilus assembly chaperone PapD
MIRTVRHSLTFAGLFFVHAVAPVVGVVQIAHAQETSAQGQAKFNVTLTRLVLRPSQTSTSLLLKNESNEVIRFQVSD